MSAMASQSPTSPLIALLLVQAQIKENIKAPRHWPLRVTGEFPAQKASNAENISIWWRHQDMRKFNKANRKEDGHLNMVI